MENKIKEFYCTKEEIDKFTKVATIQSNRGICFEFPEEFTQKLVENMFALSAQFEYRQLQDVDKMYMKLDLLYYTAKKISTKILKNISVYFLLDNDETILLDVTSNFDQTDQDLVFSHMIRENVHLDIEVAQFIKIATAKKIEWRIPGLSDGEFSKNALDSIKGFYNGAFDDEYEKEALLESIKIIEENKKRDKEIEERKKQAQEEEDAQLKDEDEGAKEKHVAEKKTPRWLIWVGAFFIISGIFKLTGLTKDNSQPATENVETAVVNDQPGYYCVNYDQVDGIVSYKNVLKTKNNPRKIKAMQKLNISKVENGLGYFEKFMDEGFDLNYIPAGWVDMSLLYKSDIIEPSERYTVNSVEVDGVDVYKDYNLNKKYKSKLSAMQEVQVVLTVDGKIGYIRDVVFNNDYLNKVSGWVDLSKFQKND